MHRKAGISLAIVLLAAIVLLLLIQGQQTTGAGPSREALSSPPDFVGWVLKVDPGSGQVKVESQADKIVRPVIVKLTKDTMIFRREKGGLRQVEFSDIHLQDQAELWLIGPVPSSFPAEVNVRQIVVENPY
ncbi:MAG: hypothetical protein ACM3XO_25060 [Bacteroidota bacterium]